MGCFASHVVDPLHDASVSDSNADSSADATLDGSIDPSLCERCGCIGGLRRCDTCDDPCPAGTTCWETLGVCRPFDRATSPREDVCELRLDSESRPGLLPGVREPGCPRGWACAVDQASEGTLRDPFRGLCMPPAYCVEVVGAEPPVASDIRCMYPDGTFADAVPPTGECPESRSERAPFCGPACGFAECPEVDDLPRLPSCVGVSAVRAFGICNTAADLRCLERESVGARPNAGIIDACERATGDRCACFVPVPQRTTEGEHGFPVPRRACHAYANAYPDHVRCVDDAWNPI